MSNQKNSGKIFIWILVIVAGVGGLIWYAKTRPALPEQEVISKQGLHWHPELKITILGKTQEIPGGIGLEGLPHKPMHTHDSDNVIHLEFAGRVLAEDIKLGKFFQVWGKTFNKDCIFDRCSGPEGTLKMLVNGELNSEFENYAMQDNDKIEIIFEALSEKISEIQEITVTGTEFSFLPASITAKAGEKVKLTFKNNGGAPHNLAIEGLGISTKTIGGGKTDIVEFAAPASGTYTFFCSVPGHKEAGMKGTLRVE